VHGEAVYLKNHKLFYMKFPHHVAFSQKAVAKICLLCSHRVSSNDTFTCQTRNSAIAEGPRDAIVSIEKSTQSMNGLDIHVMSSQLPLLNGRTAYHYLFEDCCFNVFI